MKNLLQVFVLFLCAFISLQVNAQQTVYTRSIQSFNSDFMLPWAGNSQLVFGEKPEICKLNAAGNILWTRSYVFDNTAIFPLARFYDAVIGLDSTIAVTGNTNKQSPFGKAFIIKIKPNGDTLWCRQISAPTFSSFIPYAISNTNDSGFVVTGAAIPVSGPNQLLFIAKITKSGNLSWLQTYANGTNYSKGCAIKQMPDSGYLVAGAKQFSTNFNWSMVILRTNKNGQQLWAKQYDNVNQLSCYGFDLKLNQNNFTVLVATSYPGLMNFDFSGNLNWSKSYMDYVNFGMGFDVDMRLKSTLKKGYLLINKAVDYPYGSVIVTDSLGNAGWYAVPSMQKIDALQNKDKSFNIIGNRMNTPIVANRADLYNPDVQIFKTDSMGQINPFTCYSASTVNPLTLTLSVSSLTFTNTSAGAISAIHPTLGTVNYSSNSGCLEYPSGINENKLNQLNIFPNPSNGLVNIQLPEAFTGRLKITDVCGKELISSVINNQSGYYTADYSELANGVYQIQLLKNNQLLHQAKLIITH